MVRNKEKEKSAVISCGFDETDIHLVSNLCLFNDNGFNKSFGVQSGVGGTGKHTSLINWKGAQPFVGSSYLYENPTLRALSE